MDASNLLDYGGLGFAILVLSVTAYVTRLGVLEWIKRHDERERARAAEDARHAAKEEQRRDAQDQYLRELVNQSHVQAAASVEALQALTQRQLEAQAETARTLDALCASWDQALNGHDREERHRHEAVMRALNR